MFRYLFDRIQFVTAASVVLTSVVPIQAAGPPPSRGMPMRMGMGMGNGMPRMMIMRPPMTVPSTPNMRSMNMAPNTMMSSNSLMMNRTSQWRMMNMWSSGSGINPYSFLSGTGGGSGSGGSGGGSGGGGGSGNSNPYQTYAAVYSGQEEDSYARKATAKNTELATLLTAAGMPNKDGRLIWPLGLRLLRPDKETRELRTQMDALAQTLISAQTAQANPRMFEDAERAVEKFRSLLEAERHSLSSGTFKEADAFLGKFESFIKNRQQS